MPGLEALARYAINIDGSTSLVDQIGAGKYDWYDPYLLDDFAAYRIKSQQTMAVLVHFGRPMLDEAVLEELDRRSLAPATFAQLLAFGAQHADAHRRFPTVAMGWRHVDTLGRHSYPFLQEWPRVRRICISWDRPEGWIADYRFLAVPR